MNIKFYQALAESRGRVKLLQEQIEAAKAAPRYLITLMPDSQLVYGAKPDGLQRLADAGIPLPKLPEGFGLASDASDLDTSFETAETAAIYLRDELIGKQKVSTNRLISIFKLHLWLELRLKEQQSLTDKLALYTAQDTAIAAGIDTRVIN